MKVKIISNSFSEKQEEQINEFLDSDIKVIDIKFTEVTSEGLTWATAYIMYEELLGGRHG